MFAACHIDVGTVGAQGACVPPPLPQYFGTQSLKWIIIPSYT